MHLILLLLKMRKEIFFWIKEMIFCSIIYLLMKTQMNRHAMKQSLHVIQLSHYTKKQQLQIKIFSQQVLIKEESETLKLDNSNPFGTDHLPSVGYYYRTFDLGDNTKLCVRAEYDSYELVVQNKVEKPKNILIKSLNEYDQKVTGGWRMKLENQKAGCFATELKSNNCKLSKWVFQANLADVANIKLGWISRTNPKDPYTHSILTVTNHPIKEIQSELGIDLYQVWGNVKYILNVLQKQPEGSYILIRDPNRKNVYVYKTLPNEFRKK